MSAGCVAGRGLAWGHSGGKASAWCVCVAAGVGGVWGRGIWGHGQDSDAGGKGQAMQSICCADAGRGQLLGEIRCCCSSSLEASLQS